jgi:hypothetical protein
MPELVLRAYGRTIALTGPREALAVAEELLPPAYKIEAGPAEKQWDIAIGMFFGTDPDGNWVSVPPDYVACTEAILSDVELWIAEHARRYIFVHAGCVAVDGRAIVLPGRTMSGKSSLAAALVRAGADYFSDEYAVLDASGAVRPYPRKLSLRPYGGGNSIRTPVEQLGGKRGRGPAQVALVADLQFNADRGWKPQGLTRGQAMIRLFDNTVAARSRPQAALSALEAATHDARWLTGTRGDADETASTLLAMLSE